eukprot:5831771-Pyramimonas_sp.AAC.1
MRCTYGELHAVSSSSFSQFFRVSGVCASLATPGGRISPLVGPGWARPGAVGDYRASKWTIYSNPDTFEGDSKSPPRPRHQC